MPAAASLPNGASPPVLPPAPPPPPARTGVATETGDRATGNPTGRAARAPAVRQQRTDPRRDLLERGCEVGVADRRHEAVRAEGGGQLSDPNRWVGEAVVGSSARVGDLRPGTRSRPARRIGDARRGPADLIRRHGTGDRRDEKLARRRTFQRSDARGDLGDRHQNAVALRRRAVLQGDHVARLPGRRHPRRPRAVAQMTELVAAILIRRAVIGGDHWCRCRWHRAPRRSRPVPSSHPRW